MIYKHKVFYGVILVVIIVASIGTMIALDVVRNKVPESYSIPTDNLVPNTTSTSTASTSIDEIDAIPKPW